MKSVLIVDDDANVLLGAGVRLKSMGYTVFTARDAITAISVAVKNTPDVVVLDISMPGGDGFGVAERLSRLTSMAATPVIFITANGSESVKERARKFGGCGILVKPFGATELADKIESALTPDDNWKATVTAS